MKNYFKTYESFVNEGYEGSLSGLALKIYKTNKKELLKLGRNSDEETAQETSDTIADNNIEDYLKKNKNITLSKNDRKTLFKTLSQNIYYTIFNEDGVYAED